MAESTLSAEYVDIVSALGRHFMGGRQAFSGYTSAQQADLTDWIDDGLRSFYMNARHSDPRIGHHRWSFLYVDDTVTTVADQWEYDLPDDYGGIEGIVTFSTASLGQSALERVQAQQILKDRQYNTVNTSYPMKYAIRPKDDGTATTDGQRFEMLLWPTPTAVYTLTYKKMLNPNIIDATNVYPNGGMQHSGTIKLACLASAERMCNPEDTRWRSEYQQSLDSSIELDRHAGAPDRLGINRDRSDMPVRYPQVRNVTYNGVQY